MALANYWERFFQNMRHYIIVSLIKWRLQRGRILEKHAQSQEVGKENTAEDLLACIVFNHDVNSYSYLVGDLYPSSLVTARLQLDFILILTTQDQGNCDFDWEW